LREEDNIEKEGLQEDNLDIGDNSGDEDFAEYDDLSALEGLPQIDELDNMDDLSGVSDVASTIDFDESGHQDESEDDIDIPLPDIDFSEDDGIASELSDGSDIKTTYPEIKDDDNNAADDSTVEEPQVSEDIATEKDAEIETQSDAEAEQSGADIMSLSEDGADEEQSDADIMSLSEDGADEEQSDADIMSLSEDGADEEQPDNDIMSLTEDGADEEQPDNDIMSLTEDGTADDESGSIDDMLGGLLDDFDANGSIGYDTEEQPKKNNESESDAGDGQKTDDLSDLLGMLSDDSTSDDVISLDSVSNEEIPDISEIPDIPMQEEEDISNILPQNEEKEDDGEKQSIFKKVFGNVVTDEIAEAEKKQEEEEAAKKEEAEKVKEEKAAEKAKQKEEKEKLKAEKAEAKAAAKAKKAEEKAAKKAEKQAQKEAEREAAANEVVGKLNKVGVSIVAVFGVIILAGIIIGTNSFGSGLDKKKATNYFEMHRYSQAYESAVGTNMKEKNPEQYKKIVTVMKVQHALDSYQNYENVKKYPEALDALLMGLKKYDANKKTAYDLEIENDLASVYDKILDILSDEFGLSKSQAYDILSLGSSEYTSKVNAIAAK
jgi:membrane protein involved in colicin uptake